LLSQKEKEYFHLRRNLCQKNHREKEKRKEAKHQPPICNSKTVKKRGKRKLYPTLRLPKECKETGNRVVTEEQQKELRLNSNLAQIRNCKS
jgi:hypothetical protein